MANATAGEPLGYRHGVVLYSAQTVQGTAVTPATSCGVAQVRFSKQSENLAIRGPGAAQIVLQKGGAISSDISLTFSGVQTGIKALLLKAVRVDNVLPWVTLGIGYRDDQTGVNTIRSAEQVQDCKVGSLRLGLDASNGHGPLTAEMSLTGGLCTTLTTLNPAASATPPWMTYEGVLTEEGAAFPVRNLDVSIEHNVTKDPVIPGSAPASFVRGWKYLTEHGEDISGTITRYSPVSPNVHANTTSERDFVLTLTSQTDATVLTLAVTNAVYGAAEMGVDESGIFWSYPFVATSWSLT